MSHITAAMLPALLGRPVAYQPIFTRLPGVSVQGAIFLSQALFLTNTPTARARQGWFWKEQAGAVDSWESETGMSAKQQMTARRQLVALGVLQEQRKGVPAKTWYRVDTEALALALYQVLEPAESPANPHETPDSPVGRNCNLPNGETRDAQPECTESPDGSFLTETTTESNPPPSDASAVGFTDRISQALKLAHQNGVTQAALAEQCGISPQAVGQWPRSGKVSARNLAILAAAAGCSLDWLYAVAPAADVFDRAAEQDDQGQPRGEYEARVAEAHRQFPMTYGWQPEPEALAAACWRRGLPSNVTPTPATLADFTAHFAEKPEQRLTHQGWHERLAKWLDENRRKAMTTGGTDDRNADRPRHERAEREAVREQLANPHDFSWADGLWPDDEPDAGAQGGDPGAGGPGVHSAGVDLPEDVFQRVPECGPAQAEPSRAGGGAGAVAGGAHSAGGGASHERAEAVGEYLAADDPGAGADAGAHPGGFRHADDW